MRSILSVKFFLEDVFYCRMLLEMLIITIHTAQVMITETTPPKKQPQPNASLSSPTTMPIMIEPISPKTNTA